MENRMHLAFDSSYNTISINFSSFLSSDFDRRIRHEQHCQLESFPFKMCVDKSKAWHSNMKFQVWQTKSNNICECVDSDGF